MKRNKATLIILTLMLFYVPPGGARTKTRDS